jgi:meiosis-specific protein HOP1
VKKLIVIAISNIAYLRALFPEDSFVDRQFEGFKIKILRPDTTSSLDSKILSEWLRGAFEAIDLRYVTHVSVNRDCVGFN